MNAQFFYRGPLREMAFRYAGPPWVLLVILLGVALAFFRLLA
jgi:hypothetical protein